MAITVNDLKLVESENMSNAQEGGGGCTNTIIIDGMSNNLFDDVTQQDRVYGKVNERKVFAAVRTTSTDKLMSAMAYVSKLPKDANINVNLARSESWFDNRMTHKFKQRKTADKLNQQMRLDKGYMLYVYADTKYGFQESKFMNCVIIGNLSVDSTQIFVSGIDGISMNSNCYGVEGLKKILFNKFFLDDGTKGEVVTVKSVEIMSYANASEDSENYPYWTSNYDAGDSSIRPMKKYTATLTLSGKLKNAYTGAIIDDYATWFSNNVKMYPTKEVLKDFFYTAKKIITQASSGASTLTVASTENKLIPFVNGLDLSDETLGIDTSKFNADGIYDAFMSSDVICIFNDKETTGTYSNGQVITLTRQNLAKVTIRDSANNLIDAARFSTNLIAGVIQFVDVSGLSQPLKITDRIEDLGLVSNVSGNTLTLHKPLKNSYPVEGTIVSNCCLFGTLYANVSKPFDQQTWTNVWSDTPIGSTVTAQFDFNNYPIVVNNLNTVTDRWAIIFISSTTYNLVSEQLGQLVTGHSVSTDLEPINPNTNQPYFTLPTLGLGGGWSAGNVVRFNTYAAAAPFWVLQSISQGDATDPDFDFAIEVRGDIDAP